jgi:hypothetical protein
MSIESSTKPEMVGVARLIGLRCRVIRDRIDATKCRNSPLPLGSSPKEIPHLALFPVLGTALHHPATHIRAHRIAAIRI